MYYVYVIQSQKDKKWYTGSTNDLRKRFNEHNSGKVFSTKNRGPFRLIYYEGCLNEYDARTREKYLKSSMGKRYLRNRLKRFLSLTGFTLLEINHLNKYLRPDVTSRLSLTGPVRNLSYYNRNIISNRAGFTLFELILVMAIMIILTVVASTGFYSYDWLKLDAAAQKIAADIRYTQRLVMDNASQFYYDYIDDDGKACRQVVGIIDFDVSNNTYYVMNQPQPVSACSFSQSPVIYSAATAITDPFTREPLRVNLTQDYPGVHIQSVNFGGSPKLLNFSGYLGEAKAGVWFCNPFANPFTMTATVTSSSASLPSAGGTITLEYKGKTKIIRIAQSTGRVTIE